MCVCMFYVYEHKSRTWEWWVKDLLCLVNSPHTSNVTDSYVKSTYLQYCIEVVTITYLKLSVGLAILWFY